MNIYVRAIKRHDITHQISITKEVLHDFFEKTDNNSYINVKTIKSQTIGKVVFLTATDPRCGGDISQLLKAEGGIKEGDFILFQKAGNENFSLGVVRPNDSQYQTYLNLMKTDRHLIVSTDDNLKNVSSIQSISPHTTSLSLAVRTFLKFRATEEGKKEGIAVNDGIRNCISTIGSFEDFGEEEFTNFCENQKGLNEEDWEKIKNENHKEWSKSFEELRKKACGDGEADDGRQGAAVPPNVVSELLMKFNPEKYCAYGKKCFDAFKLLGLIDGEFNGKFSAIEYTRAMGAAATILIELQKEKVSKKTSLLSGDADYLTVNEFLFFVANHEEEIMKSKLVTVKCDPEYGEKSLDQNDPLMIRLMAALRTKPFAILAGHSGTGKSRMVRKLAYMTCCDKGLRMDEDGKYLDQPGNFCMIQVKPNWHDNTELLGYYSEMKGGYHATDFLRFICKAYAYPDVPFFVCLDEMNLAPVEHYFAEYLSAIESAKLEEAGNRKVQITDPLVPKDKSLYDYPTDLGADTIQAVEWIAAHGLTIPKNLFVVGTVNMDETTCQFSRKVLDRAMTIEMNEVKFDNFGETDPAIDYGLLLKDAPIKALLAGKSLFYPEKDDKDISKIREYLAKLDDALKGTAFRVAYRFANEYALYARALNKFDEKINNLLETAFDHMVLMKVLPRIADEKSKVYKIFDELEKLEALKKLADSLSLKKIAEIKARNAAYPSFWP